MSRYIPLELLEHVEHAIFLTDEEGHVESANPAAVALLGYDPSAIPGAKCWEVIGLCSQEGRLFCREQCESQRRARAGSLPGSVPVVLVKAGVPPVHLRLFVFPVAQRPGGRIAAVHLLKSAEEEKPEQDAHGAPEPQVPAPMDCLTPREHEVMRQLAAGMGTEEIARTLFVSPCTVRNHVRHILAKLGKHHRIEAILTWLLTEGDRPTAR